MPDEFRLLGRKDPRFFGPDAQFRYERQVEQPALDEGFAHIEDLPFVRRGRNGFEQKAMFVEYDGVLCASARGEAVALERADVVVQPPTREVMERHHVAGYKLFVIAWRPQIREGATSDAEVTACFERTRTLLGFDVEFACCPHAAGPPICWCRKPLPGIVLQFAFQHHLDLEQCILVGRSTADRTLAQRTGMRYMSLF